MSLISIIIFKRSKEELQNRIVEKLNIINDLKIERIQAHFENVNKSINHIEYNSDLEPYFLDIIHLNSQVDSLREKALIAQVRLKTVFESLEKIYGFNRIMLRGLDGNGLIESRKIKNLTNNDSLLYKTNAHIFIDAQKKVVYSDIYHPVGKEEEFYLTVLTPYFKNKNEKEPLAIVCCEIQMHPIFEAVRDTTGLGMTGETILSKRIYNKMHFISRPRDFIGDFLKMEFELNKSNTRPTASQLSVLDKDKKNGSAFEIMDFKGNLVDAAWGFIPGVEWGITTKIDHKESFTSIQYLKAIIILLCSGILFFSVIVITIFVEKFLTPIINIRDNLVSLAKGKFPKNLDYDMTDEIKDTTVALNNLVERLKNSTDFAKQIGEGNLNAKYYGRQTQDVLSASLLRMQESLRRIEEENNRRKWATEGFAIHGELFRKNISDIHLLGEKFIRSLTPYVECMHGAIYVVDFVGRNSGVITLNDENLFFELIGTYAVDLKDDHPRKFRLGQSLVGQCAKEKRTIVVSNNENNKNFISSGLGKGAASHVICVPMILNDQVMGVVELANFSPFPQYVINFIEMLGESFASAVLSVKTSFQTLDTLKEFEITTSDLMQEQEDLKERYENALTEIKALKNKINKLEKNQQNLN